MFQLNNQANYDIIMTSCLILGGVSGPKQLATVIAAGSLARIICAAADGLDLGCGIKRCEANFL
jgi:hypothetical protein